MTILSTLRPNVNPNLRILPVRPNWRDKVRVSYEFKTDIITSGDGHEQRRAVRSNPRKTVEFSSDYAGEAKIMLDGHFAAAQTVRSLIPDFTRYVMLTAPIIPPDDINDPNYEQRCFFEQTGTGEAPPWMSGTVLLVNGWHMETRVVAGADDRSAWFTEFNLSHFPEGTRIYPALRGFLQAQPKTTRLTNAVAVLAIKFDVDPGFEQYPATPPGPMVGFREYFGKRANWSNPLDVTYTKPREDVDYGYGVTGNFVPYDFPSRLTSAAYLGRNSVEVEEVVNFFIRMRGRAREFLLPTWENDVPFYAMAGGGNGILLKGTTFGEAYKGTNVFKRILVRAIDGSFSHHRVDVIEPLPDTDSSVVWLKDPLPFAELSPRTVAGISWVLASRFASDRLDIDYLTDSVAQFGLSFQSLENFEL